MPYGKIRIFLENKVKSEEQVLIESPFNETTRIGKTLRTVHLALTSENLIILPQDMTDACYMDKVVPTSVHPLNYVKLTIFKKKSRQSIKVQFQADVTAYFELGATNKRNIFWRIWCRYIEELNYDQKLWPFIFDKTSTIDYSSKLWDNLECIEIRKMNRKKEKKNRLKWTDKDIFLGTKREAEDQNRPIPIPGLGPTEEIKLLYLKPEHFGCWEQTAHWVQCRDSAAVSTDNDNYTYTGEPTSNVTYMSVINTWK